MSSQRFAGDSARYRNKLFALIGAGVLNPCDISEDRMKLAAVPAAYERTASGTILKAVIDPCGVKQSSFTPAFAPAFVARKLDVHRLRFASVLRYDGAMGTAAASGVVPNQR